MAMIRNTTRPSSVASFFSGMARCAALYFRKKRSHAPGPTTIIAGPADGAFFEGSKAQRAQHASHDREKCAGCRPCSCREHRGRRPYDRAATLDGRVLFWIADCKPVCWIERWGRFYGSRSRTYTAPVPPST